MGLSWRTHGIHRGREAARTTRESRILHVHRATGACDIFGKRYQYEAIDIYVKAVEGHVALFQVWLAPYSDERCLHLVR